MRCSIEPCYSGKRERTRETNVTDFAPPKDLATAALGGDPAALAAYLDALKARGLVQREHLGSHLGIEPVEVLTDRVTMRMPWRSELRRGGGIFHGGAIMALADHVAGNVFNTDPRIAASGSTGLTTDFNISFLRSAEPGEAVLATGWVLRRGRNVTFMQVDVRAEVSGHLIATCRGTYLTVLRASIAAKTPTAPGESGPRGV
jgi:1,4-dihydroxy-2-naphthoyl-CoA hydrolase